MDDPLRLAAANNAEWCVTDAFGTALARDELWELRVWLLRV